MLETIREFALERLEESGGADDLRRRHSSFFLRFAEVLKDEAPSEGSMRAESELGNIRAALGWAVESDRTLALGLASALRPFWDYSGRNREAQRWLDRAWTEEAPPELRKRALRARAASAVVFRDARKLAELSEQRLQLATATGDLSEAGAALNGLAIAAQFEGDFARARRLYESAGEHASSAGDRQRAANVLANLGMLARIEGDFGEARRIFMADLETRRAEGSDPDVAWALQQLGETALEEGSLAEAAVLFHEALEIVTRIGFRGAVPAVLAGAAAVASAAGNAAEAALLIGAAEEIGEVGRGKDNVLTEEPFWHRAVQATRESLGLDRFEELRQSGCELPEDRAIELALSCLD